METNKGYVVVVEEFYSDLNNIIVSVVVHTDLKAAVKEFENTVEELNPGDGYNELWVTGRYVRYTDDEDYQLNIYIHEVEIR